MKQRFEQSMIIWLQLFIAPLLLSINLLHANNPGLGSQSGNIIFNAGSDAQDEMVLTSGGNLGILIANPGNTLSVGGNVDISGTLQAQNLIILTQMNKGHQTLTGNTNLEMHSTVFLDTDSQSDIRLTLPLASEQNGQIISIKNTGAQVAYLVSESLINQDHHLLIPAHASIKLISNGTSWVNISNSNSMTVSSSNLVGWWTFDDVQINTSEDQSSYTVTGNITGAESIPGLFSNALYFDGINDYVTFPDPSDAHLDFGTDDFSVSFWYYPISNDSIQTIIQKHNGGFTYWSIINNNGVYKLLMQAGGAGISSNFSSETILLNQWSHILVSFDRDNTASLYQNGLLYGSVSISTETSSIDNSANVIIGKNQADSQIFKGYIDDVRIYNKSTSQNEAKAIMGVPDIYNDLIAHWTLDESSGNTVLNLGSLGSSGNGLTTDSGNTFNFSSNSIYGVSGNALNFDGSNDFIDVPYQSAFQPSSEITVSFWVNFQRLGSSWQSLIGNTEHGGWSFNDSEVVGKLLWAVYVNGTYSNLFYDSSNLTTGQWYHFVGTYGNGKQCFYIDGVEVGSKPATGSIQYTANNSLIIGSEAGSGSGSIERFFKGSMDQIKIYNRALSKAEVQFLHRPHPTWTPTLISPSLWLDSSDSTSITKDGSNFVSQWNDKSGNNRHATQSTSSQKPSWGLNNQNGLQTMSFDGSSDSLNVSNLGSSIGDISVFVVMKFDTFSNLSTVFGTSGAWTDHAFHYLYHGTGNTMSFSQYGQTDKKGTATQTTPTFVINAFVAKGSELGSQLDFFLNGKADGSTSHSSMPRKNLSSFTIGSWDSARYFDGEIAELLIFNEALSPLDRLKLEGYLAHKWGLHHDLDAGHPYKGAPP